MQVTVEAPMGQVDDYVARVFRDQIPFAESVALNNTAKDFQRIQRARLADVFTLRRKTWAEQSIKIKPFATKAKPEVRIAVDPPGGRGDVLGKFETDTVKTPRGSSVAVPTANVPRSAGGVIRQGWRPSQLGRTYLNRHGAERNGKGGTFLVRRGNRGTIFLRTPQGLKALYQLVPMVRIRPNLEFIQTAGKTAQEVFAKHFVVAFDRAIKTAR